jgi:predicted RecB family nuclease
MPTQPTRVFFNVEGIPERDLFYLIGAVVVKDGTATPHYFRADDESQQEGMRQDFLRLLAGFGDYVPVHFGRYEKDFIREMQRRYRREDKNGAGLASHLFDVHAPRCQRRRGGRGRFPLALHRPRPIHSQIA